MTQTRVKITIEGMSALLMNRFTEAAEVKVSSGTSAVMSGDRGTPREQAEPKAYKDSKTGMLYIPAANIFACIIEAGKFHKNGKSKLTTIKSSLIPAGMVIEGEICSLGVKKFEVDSRSVVIPSTGGRIMCHRPRLDKWSATFVLLVDETMFDIKLIRTIVDDAGSKIGLGDYRPQRKGPFGRFVVKKWEVEKLSSRSRKSETLKMAA